MAEDEAIEDSQSPIFSLHSQGPLPWVPQEWLEGVGLRVCCQDLPLPVKSRLAFERQQHDGPGRHPLG